jgi:hypothetical protein
MKYTNLLNLPDSIARAVQNDPYDRGDSDISVTGLIAPARKRQLEMRHSDEMVTDVADRIWSLYGQIVHGILERADLMHDEIITERRLFIERHGWRLSGQFDRLILKDKNTVQDYKFTSMFAVKDGVKPEFEAQQNIYRLMLRDHGYHIDHLQIVNILRDWSKLRAARDTGIPDKPVVIQHVDVWPYEKTEEFIKQRLIVHGNAQSTLPECTAEERWERDSVWKVKKKGNKTAMRGHANHATEAEARAAAEDLSKDGNAYEIEFHPGEPTRCMHYCEASEFCEQFNQINPNKLGL